MHNRFRQVQKIYKMTNNKDVRLYCVIYMLGESK